MKRRTAGVHSSAVHSSTLHPNRRYYQRDAGAVPGARTNTSNDMPYYELSAARLHRAVAAVDAGTVTGDAADAGPLEEDDDAWLHLAYVGC